MASSSLRFAGLVCIAPLLASVASCTLAGSQPEASCAGACDDEDAATTRDNPKPLGAEASSPSDPAPGSSPFLDCTKVHEPSDVVAGVPSALPNGAPDFSTDDYLALTAGVTTVDGGAGTVSPLVLYGPAAFPVTIDENGKVFGAAARVGLGKVLALGHENYIATTIKTSDDTKLVLNAIGWMANKPAPVIGIDSSLSALATTLSGLGYTTQFVKPSTLGTSNIYITRGYAAYTDAEYATVRQFVANGGGLIVGGQGWSFGGPVMNYPGNKMLLGSGIAVTLAYDVTAGLDAVAATPPSPLLNASIALTKLTQVVTGASNLSAADQTFAASQIERAAGLLPITVKEFYDQADAFVSIVNPVITAATPIVPSTNIPARTATRIQYKFTQERPPNEITAAASAADFPGAIPAGAPRETVNVQIDGTYAGRDTRYSYSGAANPVWRSTGAYAAPGEAITVTIPAALANTGLAVQIGAHTDLLWNKTPWVRFPAIVRSYPLTTAQITAASAFGGLVYITVPGGKSLGQVPVTIDNVVRAPRYVHNQTTPAEWLTARDYPAPWAEVGSDKMIVTVPSSYIRTLNDPAQAMNQWDQIMDAQADLASISHTRVRPERYLADRDISNGYMHSGYPIMGPLGEAANMVSAPALAINWGFWHEVGHNHQWQPWVMQGTTESSVNWFSVYTSEVVFNLPRAKGHSALTPESRLQRTQTYVANGKNYATWGSDAWLPLEMYLELQEWFGWQPFKDLNADYLAISPALSPATDQARVDQWTLRFAQKVGKNLGPFFTTTWGLPVSQAVLDQLAQLAPWPASSTIPGLESEPNDACAQAQTLRAPSLTGTFQLSSKSDVDWFVLPAGASDVGKVVHAVTSAGSSNTDTRVEVFSGSCASMASLGGPSPDVGYHENWFSAPIPQQGSVYVKVTYGAQAYAGYKYRLSVTYE